MRRDDFFSESDLFGMPITTLDEDFMDKVRTGVSGRSDIEVAVPLARLLHEEFERFGTDGSQVLTSQHARSAPSSTV